MIRSFELFTSSLNTGKADWDGEDLTMVRLSFMRIGHKTKVVLIS